MTKKTTTVIRLHSARDRRRTAKPESKPHTTQRSREKPKGHLMAEVADALFQQFDYGNIISHEAFEKLLVEHGHPVPEDRKDRKNWMHQQRNLLNHFGRNPMLLATLRMDKVAALGFSLTCGAAHLGVMELTTVWGDILKRDRPKEAAQKESKVIGDTRSAAPFSPQDDPAAQQYLRKMIRKEKDVMRDYHEANKLRIRMIAADTERTIEANKQKLLKNGNSKR